MTNSGGSAYSAMALCASNHCHRLSDARACLGKFRLSKSCSRIDSTKSRLARKLLLEGRCSQESTAIALWGISSLLVYSPMTVKWPCNSSISCERALAPAMDVSITSRPISTLIFLNSARASATLLAGQHINPARSKAWPNQNTKPNWESTIKIFLVSSPIVCSH
jgi:hypothetical protein